MHAYLYMPKYMDNYTCTQVMMVITHDLWTITNQGKFSSKFSAKSEANASQI